MKPIIWVFLKGEYDTLGGLILSFHEDIPAKGDIIKVEGFLFSIETIDDKRIDRVKLTLVSEDDSL